MANPEHINIVKQGVKFWNEWRERNPEIIPDLSGARLSRTNLSGIQLHLSDLRGTKLRDANLSEAYFVGSRLACASLAGANLSRAGLGWSNLFRTNLVGANLEGADLVYATLVETNLSKANLTNCHVYGVSAWNLRLESTKQQNLVITRSDESTISVDNLEVANFLYLILNNKNLRNIIDVVGRKSVLILGRFKPKRKAVLDAIRAALRKHHYVPILMDFDRPEERDITETITLLARLSRFIIADLTEPGSVAKELEAIVPNVAVAVKPIIENSERPYSMFSDYWKYPWVLDVHRYSELANLIESIEEKVIHPAELKAKELQERRVLVVGKPNKKKSKDSKV